LNTVQEEERERVEEMSLSKEQSLFLKDVVKLLTFASATGFDTTGGELYRTKEQQDIYVKEGKSKTSNSYHLKRLAIDLHFFKDGALIQDKALLQAIGDYWESLNPINKWGGNWSSFMDCPHFQRSYKGG